MRLVIVLRQGQSLTLRKMVINVHAAEKILLKKNKNVIEYERKAFPSVFSRTQSIPFPFLFPNRKEKSTMKERLAGNDYYLAKLNYHAEKMQYLQARLNVFGNKELYSRLTNQLDELQKTIAAIKQEQTLPSNFIF